MTDIRKLMEEATPGIAWLDDDAVHKGEHCQPGCVYGFVPHMGKTRIRADGNRENLDYEQSLADAALIVTIVNAAPLVLEYMKGGHHGNCSVTFHENVPDVVECTCCYSALARALGVEE